MKLFLTFLITFTLFFVNSQSSKKLIVLYERWTMLEIDSIEIALNASYGFKVVEKPHLSSFRNFINREKSLKKIQELNGNCWAINYYNDAKNLGVVTSLYFRTQVFVDTTIVKVKLLTTIEDEDKNRFGHHNLGCWRGPTLLHFEVVEVIEGQLNKKQVNVFVFWSFDKFYRHRNKKDKIYKLKLAKQFDCKSNKLEDNYWIVD